MNPKSIFILGTCMQEGLARGMKQTTGLVVKGGNF